MRTCVSTEGHSLLQQQHWYPRVLGLTKDFHAVIFPLRPNEWVLAAFAGHPLALRWNHCLGKRQCYCCSSYLQSYRTSPWGTVCHRSFLYSSVLCLQSTVCFKIPASAFELWAGTFRCSVQHTGVSVKEPIQAPSCQRLHMQNAFAIQSALGGLGTPAATVTINIVGSCQNFVNQDVSLTFLSLMRWPIVDSSDHGC